MDLKIIETEFNQFLAEGGFTKVTWANVSAEDLERVLPLCSTETEAASELVGLFSHPLNFC
jgi:hypothetical protein